MSIIDRVFKNWKTSLIGILILGGSLATVFVGKASLTEAGAFIVMGIGFFFLKDGRNGAPPPAAIVLLCVLLMGCGANYHLKRSKYHLQMAIAKGAVITADTIFKEIPVVTERMVHDTVVRHTNRTDTLFIKHTKYSVKLKYDTIHKTQYVQVECKPDTILVRVPVKVETEVTPYRIPISLYVLGGIALLIIIALSVYALRQR